MSKEVILQLAQKMLDRELGIIEGCYTIWQQRPRLEHSDLQAEVLLPYIGFESEMHNYPIGESRKHWNPEALRAKDERLRVIVAAAEPEIWFAMPFASAGRSHCEGSEAGIASDSGVRAGLLRDGFRIVDAGDGRVNVTCRIGGGVVSTSFSKSEMETTGRQWIKDKAVPGRA